MARGIIYIRVSSDEQIKGMSLDFQKQDCLAYAQKKQIEVDRLFAEEGESAKFADRPELIGLLEYCRKHKKSIDALIVWKLDRLSRNQLDYYYLKRILLELGIAIHSATEPSMEDSSSIPGKIFETFSALQAEIDNTVRSERTRRGMEAKIMSGIFPWRPPLGYRTWGAKKHGEKKNRPDETDPVLFPIIQAALHQYATGQFSQQDLVRLLDENGLAGARDKKTHFQQVSRMLYRNLDYYRGCLVNPWTGERIRGLHQAMIDDGEYRRIVAARDGRGRALAVKKIVHSPDFPLRRLLICAECRRFLTGSFSRGNGGRYGYYHCRTRGCPAYGKAVRKAEIEMVIDGLLSRYRLTESFLLRFKESLARILQEVNRAAQTKIAQCQARLADLEAKRQRIYEMREDGSYGKEEFLERKAAVEREIDTVKLDLDEAATQEYDLDQVFEYAIDLTRNFGQKWDDMPPEVWQRFHQVVFPEGILYDREKGVGTVKVGLIFKLNREFCASDSPIVPLPRVVWNQAVEELRKLARLVEYSLKPAQ